MKDRLKALAGRAAMVVLIAILASMLAYSLPFDLAMLGAIDMTIYLDAFLGAYILSRAAPWRSVASGAWTWVRRNMERVARRPRNRDRRSTPISPPVSERSANDNEDRPWRVAMAA
ncbi:MAG: hypothetical protein ABIR63_04895 [Sphingomicrobium sp.]